VRLGQVCLPYETQALNPKPRTSGKSVFGADGVRRTCRTTDPWRTTGCERRWSAENGTGGGGTETGRRLGCADRHASIFVVMCAATSACASHILRDLWVAEYP
jgi:hypothetical protein